MKNKKIQNITPTIFEEKKVRRVWHNEQWYFAINDIVEALTQTPNVSDYIKKMRQRDPELGKGWGQIVTPLSIKTTGGIQKLNCSNLEGVFRIIQSIPSPKAEPFKQWLARVGQERIGEIQNPELAVTRAKEIYDKKGYPKEWVDKRMRGIAVRNTLTDEWKERGVSKGFEYAILTDEIYKATFDKSAKEYMDYKNLDKKAGDNLRDHMGDIELKRDANVGGSVAGRTRKDIETQTGKKVISEDNFKKQKFLRENKKK